MIEVQTLTKRFDGFAALDDLTLTVPDGAIYGLVGPNGSGKSTLLRHVMGIYRQDAGTVLVDGQPVGTVEPTLVEEGSLPAIMDATSSYVTVTTDLMGGVTVIEEPFEPEIDHTAYGVLSDLLRILRETAGARVE